jgi:PAS domain S-box-containing protein
MGRIIDANQSACTMLGYDREEFLSMPLEQLHPESSQEESRERVDFVRRGESILFETDFLRSDGSTIHVEVSSNIVDFQEEVIQGIIRDITEKKKVEAELRKSEEEYRDLFDHADELIQRVGPDGGLLQVNRKWLETLGYTEDEVKGIHAFDVIHPDFQDKCKRVFRETLEGKTARNIKTVFLTKSGDEVPLVGNVNCRFEKGRPLYTRGIFRDVRES